MTAEANHAPLDDLQTGKVAVVGASGFIGTNLVLSLAQMGIPLNLLSHRTDPEFVSVRGRFNTVHGSIENEESMIRCFEGCDTVYHLVGIIAESRTRTFAGTVAEGTARLVAAAKKAGVGKIFYLSALGTSEKALSLYYRTKWEAEQHVIASGLDYTIFRPSIVYGPRDRFINRIASMVRMMPVIPVFGDGRYKLQPVYVEELCAVMAVSSRRGFTTGKTYEIGGPEQLTYLEILDIIKRTIGVRRPTIHIPMWAARGMALMLETFLKPAPLTRDQLKMMQAGSTCDHTVVEKAFGVTFSPMEMQLQKYLRR